MLDNDFGFLKKGHIYVSPRGGEISFGRYLGRIQGFYLFEPCPFAVDRGMLSGALTFAQVASAPVVELGVDWPESEQAMFALLREHLS